MSILSCRGILLRSHPYSESSRILSFLTAEHGVISLLAKGIRARSSKGVGASQTFAEGTLTFFRNPERDLHSLRDFHPEVASLALGQDLARFAGASFLAEIVLFHPLEHSDPALYLWIREVLLDLARCGEEEIPGWVLSGGWRTMAHLGFPPELDRCVRCGGPIDEAGGGEGQLSGFDAAGGGLRCPACVGDESLPRVGPSARSHLRALLAGVPPQPLPKPRVHLNLMESYCLQHLAPGRNFRSLRILRPLIPEG